MGAGARFFAKKGRKKKTDDAAATTEEEVVEEAAVEEPVVVEEVVAEVPPTPEPTVDFSGASKAQEMPSINKDLFASFDLGDVKVVESAPDNKPPTQEDTIEGRYASVLF